MHSTDGARRLRILAVEDESLVLMLLKDMIADLGHVCAAACTRLDDALAAADAETYDLAILDVNLKGRETYAVAERIVARNKPLIFATGYGIRGMADHWRSRPILQKPFDLQALRAAIETALAQT